MIWECWLNSDDSEHGPVADFCEYDNEPSGCIKDDKSEQSFISQKRTWLVNMQLLF